MVIKKSVNSDSEVFCGTTRPALITSDSNTLLVEFTSDNTVQRTGFSASFFTGNLLYMGLLQAELRLLHTPSLAVNTLGPLPAFKADMCFLD